ncbi:unnamed protein product [Leptosia nina]|uniref:Uncharacterized protein n=1 Tax=Leptosia nina TaxID=320188 RepID=A0AAV1JDM9_9NEOP
MAKVAVVTGANKGLGLALVKGLCQELNGIVYLTSRDLKRGLKACNILKFQGLDPEFHHLNITDNEGIQEFVKFIKDKHEKIDILINNAGVLFLKDAPEPKTFQAEQTLLVNFYSLVNFTEAMLPLIRENGTILNISSSRLKRNGPRVSEECEDEYRYQSLGLITVRRIQSGCNAYTFMLNRRLAPSHITVNCVHPGYVISDMTNGAGSITPEQGAVIPLQLALHPENGGLYVWHDGSRVPWDGPDPRGYIDRIL